MESYGFSRAAVRAALARLRADRLVLAEPRRRHVIAPLTLRDVREIYDLRLLLEPAAAAQAAGRLEPAELARLEQLGATTLDIEDPDSVERFMAANRAVHVAVADAAGNTRAAAIVARTARRFPSGAAGGTPRRRAAGACVRATSTCSCWRLSAPETVTTPSGSCAWRSSDSATSWSRPSAARTQCSTQRSWPKPRQARRSTDAPGKELGRARYERARTHHAPALSVARRRSVQHDVAEGVGKQVQVGRRRSEPQAGPDRAGHRRPAAGRQLCPQPAELLAGGPE